MRLTDFAFILKRAVSSMALNFSEYIDGSAGLKNARCSSNAQDFRTPAYQTITVAPEAVRIHARGRGQCDLRRKTP